MPWRLNSLAVAWLIALAACGGNNERHTSHSSLGIAANTVVGSWETAARKAGVTFTETGVATFFNAGHMCPTFWATYTVRNDKVISTELSGHRRRIMTLGSDGLLRDATSVYRRVKSVTFSTHGHLRC